jgi:Poly(ADP-ribose) polymerase catalytic domain
MFLTYLESPRCMITEQCRCCLQGLKVAPPEAPTTGYMFGKGVYFADMSSKSANYCFTNRYQYLSVVFNIYR